MNLFATIDSSVDNLDRPLYFGGPFDRKWYHIFPVLSRGPSSNSFIEETPYDPTIRTEFENGAQLTRAKFTTAPKLWSIILEHLTNTDKVTLDEFQRNAVRFGAKVFKWENGQDRETYRVKFAGPIMFTIRPKNIKFIPDKWMAEFQLVTA